MKDFSRHQYNFSTIRIEQKIIYTVFLGFMLLGIASILIFYLAKTGLGYWGIVDYYRGNEAKMIFGKTFQELWEITHFHVFTMPVTLLIFAHLYALTRVSPLWKATVMLAAATGIAMDIASGWLIVYAGSVFAALKILGRLLMALSFSIFIATPVYEMWFKKTKSHT